MTDDEITVTKDELKKIIDKTATKTIEKHSEGYKNFCELYPNLCTKEDAQKIVSEEIAKIKIPEPQPVDLKPVLEKIEGLKTPKPDEHGLKHPTSAFMSYCPSCGLKIRDKPPTHECKTCGVPVDVRDNACWNCGGTKAKLRQLKIE